MPPTLFSRTFLLEVVKGQRVDLAGDDRGGVGVHRQGKGEVADPGEHVHHRLAPAVQRGHAQLLVDVAGGEHDAGRVQLVVQPVLEMDRLGAIAAQHLHVRGAEDPVDADPVPEHGAGVQDPGVRLGHLSLVGNKLVRQAKDQDIAQHLPVAGEEGPSDVRGRRPIPPPQS